MVFLSRISKFKISNGTSEDKCLLVLKMYPINQHPLKFVLPLEAHTHQDVLFK